MHPRISASVDKASTTAKYKTLVLQDNEDELEAGAQISEIEFRARPLHHTYNKNKSHLTFIRPGDTETTRDQFLTETDAPYSS